jgi:predicted DNA-binding protein (UPF0251 family)
LMRKHGIEHVFAIPIVANNHRAIFTVAATDGTAAAFEARIRRNLRWFQILANAVDRIGRAEFSADIHSGKGKLPIPINLKPLKLLTALATKDLSLNEAAELLDISISTANQHIAAAKRAFRTKTIHGAIVAAIQSGYIFLDI